MDFAFGNVHVGDTVNQAVSISNIATADAFSESLNASFGSANDARITNNGLSISQLAAGNTDNSTMVVGLNTSAAGIVNGTQTINFASDGTGSSGLGITALANQDLAVSATINGNVFRLANPVINNNQPIAFGNFREGDAVTAQAISISNDVPDDNFSEKLNAQAAGNTGGVLNNGGSFNLLGPGATDSSSITVSIDTSTAGNKAGNATIDFQSDGTGSSGLGITPLTSQDVAVTGQVFRLAQAGVHTPEPVVMADSHVGDTAQQALSITNTAANDGFSESLNAAIGNGTGDVTGTGSFNLLAAQATNNSSLVVSIDTTSAGAKSGTATISSESDGTGTSGIVPNVALADQTVNVSGNVYRLAEASVHIPEPVVLANVHVGDVSQQALTISNIAANDGFSENLNASIGGATGNATATGSFTGLGAGATNSSSLVVGIDTAIAGARTGTASIGLVSDGNGINSLGQTALSGQTVTVSGNVYRLAEAHIDNPVDFAFGNVHVGDTVNQAVSISNIATADAFSESLNASFGSANDARITNNGLSISQLAAGNTDNSTMVVGLNTSAAGIVNGTQTINFASDGTGSSGLGITALANQDLAVSATINGNVFRLANPVINNNQPIAFGNFREGDAVTAQAISISNDVPDDNFSEKLNAQAAGNTGGVLNNGGSFNLLGPGATDSSSITVSIDTSTAGNKAGNATIDFQSDGTGSSGLGITPLTSQDVAVTGQVFRLAEASVSPDPVILNARVGDTVQQSLTVANIAVADGFSEQLGVVSTGTTGDAQLSGAVVGLIAAQSSDNNLLASLDTSTSGVKSGSVEIGFTSDGTGTSGLSAIANGSASVAVSGNIWDAAVADIQQTTIDFGIVHVGDSVPEQALSVTNSATVSALNDVLTGSFSGTTGPFTASGDLGAGLAAGQTDNSSMKVGMDTANAGFYNGSTSVDLASHNNDLSDLNLTSMDISLTGQVNNYANPDFNFVTGNGLLSGSGDAFLLDFGTILLGSNTLLNSSLSVGNDVTGLADLLDGTFDIGAAGIFSVSNFNAFMDLDAGSYIDNLLVDLDTSGLNTGLFQGSIIFNAAGHNASGYYNTFDPITLTMRARIVDTSVPEPGSIVLLLLGLFVLWQMAIRTPRTAN